MARGDFVLIKGFDKVGKWIRVGEIVNGDGLHSLYSHAAMIASDDADPLIIEAEPGGARKNRLSAYGDNWIMSSWNLTDDQRTHLADSAFDMLGIGYSFLDYGSLALARFHIRPKIVINYIGNTRHMICSQMVDQWYLNNHLNMFHDNRFPGDVTPQDLDLVLTGPQVT